MSVTACLGVGGALGMLIPLVLVNLIILFNNLSKAIILTGQLSLIFHEYFIWQVQKTADYFGNRNIVGF
jgi:hypothetical protein